MIGKIKIEKEGYNSLDILPAGRHKKIILDD